MIKRSGSNHIRTNISLVTCDEIQPPVVICTSINDLSALFDQKDKCRIINSGFYCQLSGNNIVFGSLYPIIKM